MKDVGRCGPCGGCAARCCAHLARMNVSVVVFSIGDCQNYGPFLGLYCNTGLNTGPNLGDPKRDQNFDNLPYRDYIKHKVQGFRVKGMRV